MASTDNLKVTLTHPPCNVRYTAEGVIHECGRPADRLLNWKDGALAVCSDHAARLGEVKVFIYD